MCQGFNHFSGFFLHHFVLAKLATSLVGHVLESLYQWIYPTWFLSFGILIIELSEIVKLSRFLIFRHDWVIAEYKMKHLWLMYKSICLKAIRMISFNVRTENILLDTRLKTNPFYLFQKYLCLWRHLWTSWSINKAGLCQDMYWGRKTDLLWGNILKCCLPCIFR